MNRPLTDTPVMWSMGLLLTGGIVAAFSVLLSYWMSPAITIGLLAGAGGLWLVQKFRIGAVVLLLLSLPLGRITLVQLGPVPVSPVTVLVLLLFGLWSLSVLVGQQRIEASWMQLPLAVFLLCGVASFYGAQNTADSAKIFLIFAMSSVVYLVVSQTLGSVEEARGVVWAVAGAAAAVGVYAIWSSFEGSGGLSGINVYEGEDSYSRVEGIFTHPNQMGGFLALAIPPMVALTASESHFWRRTLGYILVTAAIIGLVLSYSRGAWVGVCFGLLFLLLFLRKGFGAVLGLGLVGTFTVSGVALERLQSIASAGTDQAFSSRIEFWGIALGMVADHPLFGVGLGNFQEAYGSLTIPGLPLLPISFEVPVSAHNLFLNLAVEVGLVGAAAFGTIFIVAFLRVLRINRTADRQARALSLGLAAGMMALLIHNFVDVTIYQGFTAIVLFAYLGTLDYLGTSRDEPVG